MPKTTHDFKAAVFKALAHPNRLRILEALRGEGEICNCELGPSLELEQSNLSRHLLALSEAGLVVARKEGVRMMYYVADPRVFTLVDLAGEIVKQQLAERAGILEIL
jgi:ArsR family transcriptional regulator